MQVIIYKQDDGRVSVICPTPEALDTFGIEAIAFKDVPAGKRFKIIDRSEVPQGSEERLAWRVDDSYLDDGVGADWDVFPVEMFQ